MQYAKLENGYLIPAPGEVRQGGMVIMNPGLEILGPIPNSCGKWPTGPKRINI